MLKVAEKPDEGNVSDIGFRGFSDDRRSAMWLDEEVKKAKRRATTQIVELTPALARVLLARNAGNRRLREGDVENYVRDILHGQWTFNGEAIIVSSEGVLNDGQHRCEAVVRAGKPIAVPLVIGVSRASRTTVDQGRIRTIADYLSMDGHTNTTHLGAAANFIWQHKTRGHVSSGGTQRATKAELMEMVAGNDTISQSVNRMQVKGAASYGGPSMLAFCHWVFWQTAGREAADEFMDKLIGGAGLLARDPILYLRNRLVSERGRLRPNDKAELIFRAWNAWRRNETPRQLPILGGVLPVLEQ